MNRIAEIESDGQVIEHRAAMRENAERLQEMLRKAGFALLFLLLCIGLNVPFAAGFPLNHLAQTIPFFDGVDFVITIGFFLYAVYRCALVWAAWSVAHERQKFAADLLEVRYDLTPKEARNYLRKDKGLR
jgi:hypothetical protein